MKNSDTPESVLTAVNIAMIISVVKVAGVSNPVLFRTCSESLLEIFRRPSSSTLSQLRIGSVDEESVQSLISYAEDVANKTRGIDRSLAIGVILGAAVSAGSLKDVLRVVQQLRNGSEKLPEKAYSFVKSLNDRTAHW